MPPSACACRLCRSSPRTPRRKLTARFAVGFLLRRRSGLEDSRLNYVEQHAARLGVDVGRLEAGRVSAAQGGPVGDTLDLCARYVDAAALLELAPRLSGLVRRGTGLSTRAGAGRFVSTVARRLGAAAAPAAPALMRALQEAARAERSPAVRRAYASANAVLAAHAAPARVDAAVAQWLQWYEADDADVAARGVAGLLLRALGREAGDVFAGHASAVAPVAYLAQFDDDADVAATWREVWEEATTSVGAGLRLHMGPVLERVRAGLTSPQWGRKKAAAAAVARLCAGAGDAAAAHAPEVMAALLRELPGRLWEGKEAVVGAVGALAAACPAALRAADAGAPAAVVAALLEAGGKKKAAYRRAALEQLEAGERARTYDLDQPCLGWGWGA
jgi:proteasome component ECM29